MLKNVSLSVSSRMVSLAANFVFIAVTARLYPKEHIAVLAVAGILTALMDVSKGLGLGTLLLKRLPKLGPAGEGEGASLILSYLFYSILPPLALAALGAASGHALSMYFFGKGDYRLEMQYGAIVGLFTVLANTNILVFQARQEFGLLATFTMATSVLQRLAPCLIAVLGKMDLGGFLFWSAALSGLAFLLTCLPLRHHLSVPGCRLLRAPDFWQESRHFYYTGLLRYGATQIDQLFVAAMFPPSTLAVYYLLRRLYSIAVVIIGCMIDALVPDLSQQAGLDRGAARSRMEDWLRLSLYTGTVGAALLAANGSRVIGLVLGASYAEDDVLILLFAVSAVSYVSFGFAQIDLVLFHEPRLSFALAAVTASVNTISGPLLACVLHVRGLPLAMALSYMAGLAASRHRSDSPAWGPGSLGFAAALITLAGLLATAVPLPNSSEWMRMIAVNAGIAAIAGWQYRRWQVGACLRRLT